MPLIGRNMESDESSFVARGPVLNEHWDDVAAAFRDDP